MQPRMSTEIRITTTSAYRIDCAGEVLQLLSLVLIIFMAPLF